MGEEQAYIGAMASSQNMLIRPCEGTYENLQRHIQYNSLTESHDKVPVEGSHQDTSLIPPSYTGGLQLTEHDIKTSLLDKEIMVVCEGIEPLISGTFQALQSYTLEDIVFGGKFSPCMSQKDGHFNLSVQQLSSTTICSIWQWQRI